MDTFDKGEIFFYFCILNSHNQKIVFIQNSILKRRFMEETEILFLMVQSRLFLWLRHGISNF